MQITAGLFPEKNSGSGKVNTDSRPRPWQGNDQSQNFHLTSNYESKKFEIAKSVAGNSLLNLTVFR